MKSEEVIAILQRNAAALRARGVTHAALFGSMARGEAGPESDADILIELAPDATLDVFKYAGLKEYIASLFPGPVDVVDREALKPILRARVIKDTIYAF
jgi:predicted nucleotidyltransferase